MAIVCVWLGGCATQRPVAYRLATDFTVSDPQFARTIGHLLGTPLVEGNSVTTLLNGDEIFPEMLKAIRGAQKSITLETFIYWSGTIGQEFCDALSERALAGVRVHILIDWYGSNRISAAVLNELKASGCEVQEYHPVHFLMPDTWPQLDHRTHRKILVVDGKIGFTGGVGIADEWRGHAQDPQHWRDDHFRVDGPVVAELQAVFEDNWIQTTGEVLQGDDYFPPLSAHGSQWAQVFKSSSRGGSENMQLLFLLSITAAGKDVRIETAYFVPDDLTMGALDDAVKRGVHVQVIVPGKYTDEDGVREASRARWGKLLKAGVQIYEYQPTMFHCKQIIVDDLWVSIGSANMDNRSFRLNDEANLNVQDRSFAQQQVRNFEHDKTRSRRITLADWEQRPLLEKIRDHVSSWFEWEL
ncbi:MAG: phospholipase D-like domain-containing protein [Tepidisphaeraceae bacterium]